jgi:hypothetical protein
MSMSHSNNQLIAGLADAYETSADDMAGAFHRAGVVRTPSANALADCVPLLAIAMELIDRGPSALTIEGVEGYRAKVMRLLEHIRPIVENEATVTLADWTSKLLAA